MAPCNSVFYSELETLLPLPQASASDAQLALDSCGDSGVGDLRGARAAGGRQQTGERRARQRALGVAALATSGREPVCRRRLARQLRRVPVRQPLLPAVAAPPDARAAPAAAAAAVASAAVGTGPTSSTTRSEAAARASRRF